MNRLTLRYWIAATAMFMLGYLAPAYAADLQPCPSGMICASDPQRIVDEMKAAGYSAYLLTDGRNNPQIRGSAGGIGYSIQFYDCEAGTKCASLQFIAQFNNDGTNSVAAANAWNNQKAFVQLAYLEDTDYRATHDVSTIGGLTPQNFRSILAWWKQMLQEMDSFFVSNNGS